MDKCFWSWSLKSTCGRVCVGRDDTCVSRLVAVKCGVTALRAYLKRNPHAYSVALHIEATPRAIRD